MRGIQSFEAAVGEGLPFNRTVKPAVLTARGNHVLEHCRRVLTAVAELEARTTSAADPAGELKIGVAHGLGEMVLTTPLEALRLHHARLRLQISSNWSTGLVEEVRSGAIDCAIGLLTDDHSIPAGLQRIVLGADQVVVVSASRRPTKSDGAHGNCAIWRKRTDFSIQLDAAVARRSCARSISSNSPCASPLKSSARIFSYPFCPETAACR
jgi:DNA-binding transcriptional LysR family regulator